MDHEKDYRNWKRNFRTTTNFLFVQRLPFRQSHNQMWKIRHKKKKLKKQPLANKLKNWAKLVVGFIWLQCNTEAETKASINRIFRISRIYIVSISPRIQIYECFDFHLPFAFLLDKLNFFFRFFDSFLSRHKLCAIDVWSSKVFALYSLELHQRKRSIGSENFRLACRMFGWFNNATDFWTYLHPQCRLSLSMKHQFCTHIRPRCVFFRQQRMN